MKRRMLFSVIILMSIFIQKSDANVITDEAKHLFGYDTPSTMHNEAGKWSHEDTVNFWQTTEDLYKKSGNQRYYQHAHARLEQAKNKLAHHKASKNKAAVKPNKNLAQQRAYAKGKKAGEDHERRLLKKKNNIKTHVKETKTPHKKKTKKVVKEEKVS